MVPAKVTFHDTTNSVVARAAQSKRQSTMDSAEAIAQVRSAQQHLTFETQRARRSIVDLAIVVKSHDEALRRCGPRAPTALGGDVDGPQLAGASGSGAATSSAEAGTANEQQFAQNHAVSPGHDRFQDQRRQHDGGGGRRCFATISSAAGDAADERHEHRGVMCDAIAPPDSEAESSTCVAPSAPAGTSPHSVLAGGHREAAPSSPSTSRAASGQPPRSSPSTWSPGSSEGTGTGRPGIEHPARKGKAPTTAMAARHRSTESGLPVDLVAQAEHISRLSAQKDKANARTAALLRRCEMLQQQVDECKQQAASERVLREEMARRLTASRSAVREARRSEELARRDRDALIREVDQLRALHGALESEMAVLLAQLTGPTLNLEGGANGITSTALREFAAPVSALRTTMAQAGGSAWSATSSDGFGAAAALTTSTVGTSTSEGGPDDPSIPSTSTPRWRPETAEEAAADEKLNSLARGMTRQLAAPPVTLPAWPFVDIKPVLQPVSGLARQGLAADLVMPPSFSVAVQSSSAAPIASADNAMLGKPPLSVGETAATTSRPSASGELAGAAYGSSASASVPTTAAMLLARVDSLRHTLSESHRLANESPAFDALLGGSNGPSARGAPHRTAQGRIDRWQLPAPPFESTALSSQRTTHVLPDSYAPTTTSVTSVSTLSTIPGASILDTTLSARGLRLSDRGGNESVRDGHPAFIAEYQGAAEGGGGSHLQFNPRGGRRSRSAGFGTTSCRRWSLGSTSSILRQLLTSEA